MVDFLSILAGCSLAVVFSPIIRLGYRLFPYFTKSKLPSFYNDQRYVVVTGCTDGIGKAFLSSFREKNLKVIAIARNNEKLKKLEADDPNIITVCIDFQKLSLEQLDQNESMEQILEKMNAQGKIVGLVNCIGNAHFSHYSSLSIKQINELNAVNLNPLHCLLRIAGKLKENSRFEDHPFLINISSVVGQNPFRYSAVYSATKAYQSCLLSSWSQQISGWRVLDVRPWFVRTKMVGYRSTWDSVMPEEVVSGVLKVLGKRQACAGCWKHELLNEFSWWVRPQILSSLNEQMQKLERVQAMLHARRKNKK